MSSPARLDKHNVDKNDFFSQIRDAVEAWCIKHASICILIMFILFSIIFVALIYAIMGVSATESGVVYNQFDNII